MTKHFDDAKAMTRKTAFAGAVWGLKLLLFTVGVGGLLCSGFTLRADGVVTNCTELDFLKALKGGGLVTFDCSGTINRDQPTVITLDTTIDAAGNEVIFSTETTNRLFEVQAGATLVLDGLVLTGGYVEGAPGRDGAPGESGKTGAPAYGAAVYLDGGNLEAFDTLFSLNLVQGGNGGAGADGDAVNSNGTSGGNGGAAGGGAIYCYRGQVSLFGSVFTGNTAFGGAGGEGGSGSQNLQNGNGGDGGNGGAGIGGAIYTVGGASLIISNCSFSTNSAGGDIGGLGGSGATGLSFDGSSGDAGIGQGGAILANTTTATIVGTTFDGNTAVAPDGWGGRDGLAAQSGQTGFGGGHAGGGAISFDGGSGALTNCTLALNEVVGGQGGVGGNGGTAGFGGSGGDGGDGGHALGGGLFATSGAGVRVVNCTFSLNSVEAGAGGGGGAPGTSVNQRGDPGSAGLGQGANVASSGANHLTLVNTILDESFTGALAYGPLVDGGHNLCADDSAVFTESSSRNSIDPRVEVLADNGGPTLTAALKPDSPAINTGDDSQAPPLDQRSNGRVGVSDIGAYEFQSPSPSPTLNITLNPDRVLITWSAAQTGYRLQSSTDTGQADWHEVEGVERDGGVFKWQGDVSANGTAYYRLAK